MSHRWIAVPIIAALAAPAVWAQDAWNTAPEQPVAQTAPAQTAPAPEPQDAGAASSRLAEPAGQAYHSVGMRLRWIFVPKWFITMFNVDAQARDMPTPMVSNLGVGAEYTYRKDNFDITAALWYAQLDWEDPISFKESGEPPQSWEVVTNSLQALLFTADFIWSTPIRDFVAITYGVGVGFGIPFGKITRNEATVASGGFDACPAPGWGGDSGCDWGGQYNETYDKIKVIPWLNLLVGARFKPHEHVAIYVDGGFGIGFQMGIRGGYIF